MQMLAEAAKQEHLGERLENLQENSWQRKNRHTRRQLVKSVSSFTSKKRKESRWQWSRRKLTEDTKKQMVTTALRPHLMSVPMVQSANDEANFDRKGVISLRWKESVLSRQSVGSGTVENEDSGSALRDLVGLWVGLRSVWGGACRGI